MKQAPEKLYYKNCKITWRECTRNFNGSFNYFSKRIDDALVIVTVGKKTIEYIISYGVEYKHLKKRSKSLKFDGWKINQTQFEQIVREWKFEVAEAKEKLEKEKNG